jgi:hypothetical protein
VNSGGGVLLGLLDVGSTPVPVGAVPEGVTIGSETVPVGAVPEGVTPV